MEKEISIHLLTPAELGAEEEVCVFPSDDHKYMLFQIGSKLLLFLSPIWVISDGKRCEIYHKIIHRIIQKIKLLPLEHRVLGGGTVQYRTVFRTEKKSLFISGSSADYPRPRQEILDEIKEAVLDFYQKKFPELLIKEIEARGMTEKEQW